MTSHRSLRMPYWEELNLGSLCRDGTPFIPRLRVVQLLSRRAVAGTRGHPMGRRTSLVSHPRGGRDRPEPQTPDTSVVKQKNHDRRVPPLTGTRPIWSPTRQRTELLQQYNLHTHSPSINLKVTPTTFGAVESGTNSTHAKEKTAGA